MNLFIANVALCYVQHPDNEPLDEGDAVYLDADGLLHIKRAQGRVKIGIIKQIIRAGMKQSLCYIYLRQPRKDILVMYLLDEKKGN